MKRNRLSQKIKAKTPSKGTKNSQNNLENEQSWRNQISQFQNSLQSYCNQDSVVLAQGQIQKYLHEYS